MQIWVKMNLDPLQWWPLNCYVISDNHFAQSDVLKSAVRCIVTWRPIMSLIQLLSQRVGAPRASAADYYVHRANPHLWEHMQKYIVIDAEDGIQHLK